MFLFVIASLFITIPITSINVGVLVNESLQFMAQPIIDKGIDMAQAEEVLVDQFQSEFELFNNYKNNYFNLPIFNFILFSQLFLQRSYVM